MKKVFAWVSGLFTTVTKDILPVVHSFLEGVQAVVESPVAGVIASLIPGNIATDVLSFVKQKLPLVTAEFGLVVDLTNATTVDEVNAELNKAFASVAWADATAKEKFITSFGARLFQELHVLADGTHFTFGEASVLIEQFYQGLLNADGTPAETD